MVKVWIFVVSVMTISFFLLANNNVVSVWEVNASPAQIEEQGKAVTRVWSKPFKNSGRFEESFKYYYKGPLPNGFQAVDYKKAKPENLVYVSGSKGEMFLYIFSNNLPDKRFIQKWERRNK